MKDKKKESQTRSKEISKSLKKWVIKPEHYIRILIYLPISILFIYWAIIWTPWPLIAFPFVFIRFWSFSYSEKLAKELTLKPLKKELIDEKNLNKKIKDLIIFMNKMIDFYETRLLVYLRLKNHHRIKLKIIQIIFYIQFILIFCLSFIILEQIIDSYILIQIQNINYLILVSLFLPYLESESPKRRCFFFKNWLKRIQKYLFILNNNSMIQEILTPMKEDLLNLNQRIDRFKLYFTTKNRIVKAIEKIGIITSIIVILIPPLLDLKTIQQYIPTLVISVIFSFIFLIPYIFVVNQDSRKIRKNKNILDLNSKLEQIIKDFVEVNVVGKYKKNSD